MACTRALSGANAAFGSSERTPRLASDAQNTESVTYCSAFNVAALEDCPIASFSSFGSDTLVEQVRRGGSRLR
jgi:hypothetical protein